MSSLWLLDLPLFDLVGAIAICLGSILMMIAGWRMFFHKTKIILLPMKMDVINQINHYDNDSVMRKNLPFMKNVRLFSIMLNMMPILPKVMNNKFLNCRIG